MFRKNRGRGRGRYRYRNGQRPIDASRPEMADPDTDTDPDPDDGFNRNVFLFFFFSNQRKTQLSGIGIYGQSTIGLRPRGRQRVMLWPSNGLVEIEIAIEIGIDMG